jgi:uncharacterized membrane protein HdeD (DUF308 family)
MVPVVPWVVVVTGCMVVVVGVLRVLAYIVEGHDDQILQQVLTGCMTLFVGSVVIWRARNGS